MKEITIQGDVYRFEECEGERLRLARFNKKYGIWITLEFIESAENPNEIIESYLKSSYLRRMLESST